MSISLAVRTSSGPFATDDEAHALLLADPTVPQFSLPSSPGTSNINQSIGSIPVLTGAGANAIGTSETTIVADEHWVNSKWRPMMSWLYMITCAFDFVIFPILWSIFQARVHGSVTTMWQPLTLQGGGLYHMAMGTVLGVAAYGRTKEKIASGG